MLCQEARILATVSDPPRTPGAATAFDLRLPQITSGLEVGAWAPVPPYSVVFSPPYSLLKGILAQSCLLTTLLSATKLNEKGPQGLYAPHSACGGHGPNSPGPTHHHRRIRPCFPWDRHLPHAWPHLPDLWPLQPTYGQTPEGRCQQHAYQWHPCRLRALDYGHWGHSR